MPEPASFGPSARHAALSITSAAAPESFARYSTSSAVSSVEVGTAMAPRFMRAEERGRIVDAVGQAHQHALAGADAEVAQQLREAAGARGELARR